MTTSTKCWSFRRARQGLTLVEVVAGLALMATLLVAMLVLKARFTHDLADAARQRRGIAAADALLTDWWADPAAIPVSSSGEIKGSPGLSWRTSPVPDPVVNHLGANLIRLQIAEQNRVTASVEFLLPLERRREP